MRRIILALVLVALTGEWMTPMLLPFDGCRSLSELVSSERTALFDLDVLLATSATMRVGASPANLCGVELSDGRVLPTYDWVLCALEE